MNKIFFSIIIFLIGLAAGYYFIVFAGYMAYWTSDLIVITAKVLKKYEMIYILGIVDGFTYLIRLIFTAIPIFLISGLLLTYFLKYNVKFIKWISSIGIFIIPALFGAFPAVYNARFFDALTVLAVPLLMNLFFLNKIPNIIKTPNKYEETNTNPQAD